jgi:hypothetical protein
VSVDVEVLRASLSDALRMTVLGKSCDRAVVGSDHVSLGAISRVGRAPIVGLESPKI